MAKLPWADDIDDDHYDSAQDYLTLHWDADRAESAVDRLRDASFTKQHPGDILRAANLEPLPLDDHGVVGEIHRAITNSAITPPLVINLPVGVIIADGYHRVSVAYRLAPFHKIPMKIVDTDNDGDDHEP